MKCKLPECSSQVDPEARKGTMFCGAACRAEYHRRRRLNLLTLGALPPTEDAAEMVMPGGMIAPAEQTPTFASPTTAALPLRNPRKRRRVKSRLSVPRTIHIDESPAAQPTAPTQTAKQRPRRPYDEQLRSQAPAGAAGYRLVLPLRSPTETPKIIPTAEQNGALRYWKLDPFELPDDLRLQDGHSYRILWVDSQGQPLAPKGSQSLPSLYVFLGPPDPTPSQEEAELADLLSSVSDPEQRRRILTDIIQHRMNTEKERLATERLRVQNEASAELHRQAQEKREQQQRFAIEQESVKRKWQQEEKSAEQARSDRSDKRWRKMSRRAERDALLDQSSRARERSRLMDQVLGVGITLGIPILMVTSTLILRKIKGLPIDDETLDNLKHHFTEAVTKMAEAMRESTAPPTAEVKPSAGSSTDPKAATDAANTSQSSVNPDQLALLKQALATVLSRTKEAQVAQDNSPNDSAQTVSTPEEGQADALNTVASVGPTVPATGMDSQVTDPSHELPSSSEFLLDLELPQSPPLHWAELIKTPPAIAGVPTTIRLFYWLHRPERIQAVIADIAEGDLHYEPDCPPLERNPKLSVREKRIIRQILASPKALAFAVAKYCGRKGKKYLPKLLEYVSLRRFNEPLNRAEVDAITASTASEPEAPPLAPPTPPPPPPTGAEQPLPKRAQYAEKFSLSEDQALLIASIATSADKLTQYQYEHGREEAILQKTSHPPEPLLNISADDRKTIRRLAKDEILRSATALAIAEFEQCYLSDPDCLLHLPSPFDSLKPNDVAQLRQLCTDPDRSAMLRYYLTCQDCLRNGRARPPQPATKLPQKAQKELAKLAQDRRKVAYWTFLEQRVQALPTDPVASTGQS